MPVFFFDCEKKMLCICEESEKTVNKVNKKRGKNIVKLSEDISKTQQKAQQKKEKMSLTQANVSCC
jgi:flagellar hook-basal body complex protein FliE